MKLIQLYNSNKKNKIIFLSIGIVTAFLVAFLVELFFFDFKELTSAKFHETYTASQCEKVSEQDEIDTYQIKFEKEKYISQLYLTYNTETRFTYTTYIGVCNKENYDNFEGKTEDAFVDLNKAYTPINKKTSVIKIEVPSNVAQDSEFSINIENKLQINKVRVLFLFVILVLVLEVVVLRKRLIEKLEYIFLSLSLGFGIVMILALPLGGPVTWDNEIHFQNAYFLSQGKEIEITEIAKLMIERNDFPSFDTLSEKEMVFDYVNEKTNVVQKLEKVNGFVKYGQRAYLAPAMGIKLANTLHLPFAYGIYLGKFMNLLQYIVILFVAIRFAKISKILPFLCGCIPTLLFQSVSFSYDAFVAGCIILGCTLLLGEIFSKEEIISKKRMFIAVVFIIIGSFSKAVYIPILLLVFMIKKEKLGNGTYNWLLKFSVMILMCIMMSTFVATTVGQVLSGTDLDGDYRGGHTSVSEQMKGIFAEPLDYADNLISHMEGEVGEYVLGDNILVCYKYIDGEVGNSYYVMVFLLIFVALTIGNYEKYKVNFSKKIWIFITLVGTIALIWTALYLSFTPVGIHDIYGVQPRYYLPFMILILYLCMNKCIQVKWNKNQYCGFIVMCLIYVYSSSMYNTMMSEQIINYVLG